MIWLYLTRVASLYDSVNTTLAFQDSLWCRSRNFFHSRRESKWVGGNRTEDLLFDSRRLWKKKKKSYDLHYKEIDAERIWISFWINWIGLCFAFYIIIRIFFFKILHRGGKMLKIPSRARWNFLSLRLEVREARLSWWCRNQKIYICELLGEKFRSSRNFLRPQLAKREARCLASECHLAAHSHHPPLHSNYQH